MRLRKTLIQPAAASPAPPPEAAQPRTAWPDGTRLSLTVVVCAYTMARWPDLTAAVRSLREQERPVDEIVLVIDHCPELAVRSRAAFPDVRVLENADARGLSGARNTGVAAATGDVVAFLDDDAAAEPQWAECLLAPYARREVLGVGGRVDPHWLTARPRWFPGEFDWVVGCSYRGLPRESAQVRNFIGANMSFRRGALELAGGFRCDLGRIGKHPLGCEETELCIRIAQRRPDAVLIHEPAAAVRHTVPAERATWAYFRHRCFAEGLSKAAVTRYCGSGAGLSSERSYLSSTIPAGVAAALRRARFKTAGALLGGVVLTTLGYVSGRVRPMRSRAGAKEAGDDPSAAERVATAVKIGAPPAALALWLVSLHLLNPARMNDLGLISVLPPTYWAALALLALGFSFAVRDRRASAFLLLGYVLVLIAMVHATPTLVYPTLRYSWSWKHVAIIDYLLRHNALDPGGGELTAYYQWPGFFSLNALIVRVCGLGSSLSYAAWAPPVINTMMIAPVLLIFRCATDDRRIVWTGLWVFYCGSWIGQDYLSPQGFAFMLYLSVIAVLLRRLTQRHGEGGRGWLLLLLPLIAAIDSSHQLTPIMMVTAAAALAVPRRNRRAALWVLAAAVALMAAWDSTVALPFLSQDFQTLVRSFGTLDSNAGAGLVGLGTASTGQVIVADVDRVLSAAVWTLALWALARRRHRRLHRTRMLLLMLAPMPAVLANNYGGEILYRVYFFSLPGAALLAAATLIPRARRERSAAVALPVVLGALLVGLLFSYYGKEQVNYFSPAQVEAARYLTSHAPTGSLIIAETPNYPEAYGNYERYTRIWLLAEPPDKQTRLLSITDPLAAVHSAAQGWKSGRVYFILTGSELAQIRMGGLIARPQLDSLLSNLTPANGFTRVYANTDAVLYDVTPPPTAAGASQGATR